MKKQLLTCVLAMTLSTTPVWAQTEEGNQLFLTIVDPTNPEPPNQKAPIRLPVLYIDGHTLTAAYGTLGSTINILDEDGDVAFTTYVYIEGDITLPSTLSGTFTIEVIRGSQTFVGEITL